MGCTAKQRGHGDALQRAPPPYEGNSLRTSPPRRRSLRLPPLIPPHWLRSSRLRLRRTLSVSDQTPAIFLRNPSSLSISSSYRDTTPLPSQPPPPSRTTSGGGRVSGSGGGGSGGKGKEVDDQMKGSWSPEEDLVMSLLVSKFGARSWSPIAQGIPGRSGKSCRLQLCNQLDPCVK